MLILPNSFRTALEAWHAGIPRRIGYSGNWRSPLLTHAIAPRPEATGKARGGSLVAAAAAGASRACAPSTASARPQLASRVKLPSESPRLRPRNRASSAASGAELTFKAPPGSPCPRDRRRGRRRGGPRESAHAAALRSRCQGRRGGDRRFAAPLAIVVAASIPPLPARAPVGISHGSGYCTDAALLK